MDAFPPKDIAKKAENVGVAKARLDFLSTFMLAVLAGGFVALGSAFYLNSITGSEAGYGITRLIGGLVFCLGLILVVVAGAELFTGNTLIIMAAISGRVSMGRLLRNWTIVYLGNFVGSLLTVGLIILAGHWKAGDMSVGATAYVIAGKKLSLSFAAAVASGALCNALVCIAVWLCYGSRSVADKIVAIIFPVTAFVAMGFEHSVANMFLIPYGMMLSHTPQFLSNPATVHVIEKYPVSIFTPERFLVGNLLPVTIGNIIGGAVMVGLVYWIIYLRDRTEPIDLTESEQIDHLQELSK